MPEVSILDASYNPPEGDLRDARILAPFVAMVERAKLASNPAVRFRYPGSLNYSPLYSDRGVWTYYRALAEAGLDFPPDAPPRSGHAIRPNPGGADLESATLGIGVKNWLKSHGKQGTVRMCTGDADLAALSEVLGLESSYHPRGIRRPESVPAAKTRYEEREQRGAWSSAADNPGREYPVMPLNFFAYMKVLDREAFADLAASDAEGQKEFMSAEPVCVPIGEALDVLRRARSSEWARQPQGDLGDHEVRRRQQLATVLQALDGANTQNIVVGSYPRVVYDLASRIIPIEMSSRNWATRGDDAPLGTQAALQLAFAVESVARALANPSLVATPQVSLHVTGKNLRRMLRQFLDHRTLGLNLLSGLPGMREGRDLQQHPALADAIRHSISLWG